MRKVKWGNVFKALVFVSCIGFVGYLIFMLTVYSWITSYCVTLSWLGVTLLTISIVAISVIYTDFKEQFTE